jgi:hypothetical protein
MLLAAFRIRFPELKQAVDQLVQASLDAAALSVDPVVWVEKYDEGHGLLAAHLLTLSPFGQAVRLVTNNDKSTTYLAHYQRMQVNLGDAHFLVL